MTTNELSEVLSKTSEIRKELQGLSGYLRQDIGQWLNNLSGCETGLRALAGLLQRFPDQSAVDVVHSIVSLIDRDRLSIPRLLQRINAARANGSEDKEVLFRDLESLASADLKDLLKALGGKGKNKSADQDAIRRFINGEELPANDRKPSADAQIESAYELFIAIQNDLSHLSIEEIRTRFKPLEKNTKAVLEGVARKLERKFSGNKSEIVSQLRGILEAAKGSQVQTQLIGSA